MDPKTLKLLGRCEQNPEFATAKSSVLPIEMSNESSNVVDRPVMIRLLPLFDGQLTV
jgi:hypothetical protein